MKLNKFLLLIYCLISGAQAHAQLNDSFLPQSTTRVNLLYTEFYGEKYKSLGRSTTAYGLEVESKKSNSFLGFMGTVNAQALSGEERFLDAGTERKKAISGYLVGINLGLVINLIPVASMNLKPFVGALGTAEFTYLKLPVDDSYTSINPNYSGVGTGYTLLAGIEYISKGIGGTQTKSYSVQFRYRDTGIDAFDQNPFRLSGLSMILGMGL